MIHPYIILYHARQANINSRLVHIDGYEYPSVSNADSGDASLEDCIDDADGTLWF